MRRGQLALPLCLSLALLPLAPRGSSAAWPANGVQASHLGGTTRAGIAADGSGGFYLTWLESRGVSGPSGLHAIVQHVVDAGTVDPAWPAFGSPASASYASQVPPCVAPDGSGGVFLAWADSSGQPGSPSVRLQRFGANDSVSSGWPAGGVLCCSPGVRPREVCLAADGQGNAYVGWIQDDGSDILTNHDVYLQKVTASGALGEGWPAAGVLACAAGGDQDQLSLIADNAGGALLAWADKRNTGLGQLYAVRINGSAVVATGWAANGTPVQTGSTTGVTTPAITGDGAGGAFLAWNGTDGNLDIYAQHMGPSGTRTWGSDIDGRVVCSAVGQQYGPYIARDGSGGAVVAWSDDRSGSSDAYAQRLSGSGTAAWATDGVLVASAASGKRVRGMATPPSGGAIVVFEDTRGGSGLNLYAERLDGSGLPVWDAGGVLVCQSNGVTQPSATSDGAGGVIAAWWDSRPQSPSQAGYYAAKVNAAGMTGLTPVTVSALSADVTGFEVRLRWSAFLPAATTFSVQRAGSPGGPYLPLASGIAAHPGDNDLAFVDGSAAPSTSYAYRLAYDDAGFARVTSPILVRTSDAAFALRLAGPNPAAGSARVRYELAAPSVATVEVFDLSGRRVRTLARGAASAGSHDAVWDGRTQAGEPAPGGAYFVVLEAGARRAARKLVLLR